MRIAIIGGGPAGMMCAATLAEVRPTANVFLIERNPELGKKVMISGGGRCNVTTGIQDVKTVLTNYPRGGKFLTSAMFAFPPFATFEWFESHGVPLKTQDDNRVFPKSDDGADIVRVFEKIFEQSGVHVMLNTTVERVEKVGAEFFVHFRGQSDPLIADALVLTTGGQAYRQTGSQGDGYAFAQSLGHTITPLAPSLNAFFTKEHWPARLSGLSWKCATLTAHCSEKKSFTGPFLFTHKGVSGPAVFALSSLVAFEDYGEKNPLSISIDLFPDMRLDELQVDLQHFMHEHRKKTIGNVLCMYVPKSLSEIALELTKIDTSTSASDLKKEEFIRLCDWLKGIPLSVMHRGSGDEFVTAGGVNLEEVDPSTLQSKLCPGLYFAGEILDIDGFTGGFNLQASWAAGRLVGSKIT
ncbi:MAG: NAD(P)/FAD-dependent oxidoreductase [Patescibacteria group bacterium]